MKSKNVNTHVDKALGDKSQSVSNAVSQMQSGSESAFQMVDNRPETIAQRKLQAMASNSPQAQQAGQLRTMADHYSSEQQPVQKNKNNTGIPDKLKHGIEALSGYSLDDVNVHYNSTKPTQFSAHAYAQGNTIHLGAGQEKHLPHEAWHVVQQKQGRVVPTLQMGALPVNDDRELELEADRMGSEASTTVVQDKGQTLLSGEKSDSAQMQFAMLEPLAAYLGVEATIASVAMALGIAPATLILGLHALTTLALAWSVHKVINYFTSDAAPAAAAPPVPVPAVAPPAPVPAVVPPVPVPVVAPPVPVPAVVPPVPVPVVAPPVPVPAVVPPVPVPVVAPPVPVPAVVPPVPVPVVAPPAPVPAVVPPVPVPVVAPPVPVPAVVPPAPVPVAAPPAPVPAVVPPVPVPVAVPAAAPPVFMGRNKLEELPNTTTRDVLFARAAEIGNEIDQYELGNEDDQTHNLVSLRQLQGPIAGWFATLDGFGYPSALMFRIDYSASQHAVMLQSITVNLSSCVDLLNESYEEVYPAPPAVGAGTPLTNTVTYNGIPFVTRETLQAAIALHTGDAIPINQAIGRMDTNSNVSNNNNLSRVAGGGADAALLQLRAALHCSFGMGPNGCALFFLQAGAGAITLVGIGHHYQNNSKKYEIVSAAAGYPTGRFQFPGA